MSVSFRSNSISLVTQGALRNATGGVSRALENLSSGLRINSAADDPAGLSLAETLSTDKQVFSRGVKNVSDGLSLLSIAESALHELSAITAQQSELAGQAANSSLTVAQRVALHNEANALVDEYNRIVTTTEFNDINPLAGVVNLRVQGSYGADGGSTFNLASEFDRNVGLGTFSSAISSGAIASGTAIASADFNADGILDIVVADAATASVQVRLGTGSGQFSGASVFTTTASSIRDIKAADLDLDGDMDLIVGSSALDILEGNGDGTFLARTSHITASNSIGVGDFNNDGYLDIASANNAGANIGISFGDGTLTYNAPTYFSSGFANANNIAVGDFNGDGHDDIVATATGTATANVLLANSNGTFAAAVAYTTAGGSSAVFAADFNQDGYTDIAVAGTTGVNRVSVLIANSNGTFLARNDLTTSVSFSSRYAQIGDFNSDGLPDLFTWSNGSGDLFRGNSNGTFQVKSTVSYSPSHAKGVVGDFNGDGVDDITAQDSGGAFVWMTPSNTTSSTRMQYLNLLTEGDAENSLDIIDRTDLRIHLELGNVAAATSRLTSQFAVLQDQANNSEAAVSRITDADIASEMAMLVRNQVLQEGSKALLAQANLQSNVALSLLEGSLSSES